MTNVHVVVVTHRELKLASSTFSSDILTKKLDVNYVGLKPVRSTVGCMIMKKSQMCMIEVLKNEKKCSVHCR